MKGLQDSPIGDFTRGGQTTLMMIRMIGEVFSRFGGALIIVYTCSTIGLFFWRSTEYQRYLLERYAGAAIAVHLMGNRETETVIRNPDRSIAYVTFGQVYDAPVMRNNLMGSLRMWVVDMLLAMVGCGAILFLIFSMMVRFGRRQKKEEHIRGARIVESDVARELLRAEKMASTLTVAGVPLVEGKETSHILLNGAPGTGKSTAIYELMKTIRKRGDRCICFSPSGDFIEWFYRPGKDVLLNPFDRRCPGWQLWDECTDPAHYDMVAASLVPDSESGDPFWVKASRAFVSDLIRRTAERGHTRYKTFSNLLGVAPLEFVSQYLNGLPSSRSMDPTTDRTAGNIRITVMTELRVLEHLKEPGDNAFNIRKWVAVDRSDQWIFLNARADQLASARSLLTCWLEIFTNAILGLEPRRDRRLWLIIDELPALAKQESLLKVLAEGRKYGVCGVIAFQNIAQLREIYGKDAAQNIAALCSTWVCMRQNDPETSEWVSKAFGDEEVNEQNEGLSYGSHEMRDGVSLSQQRKTRPAVLPSQIGTLKDLEGYIRMPGGMPSVHFQLDPPKVQKVANAFERGEVRPTDSGPPVLPETAAAPVRDNPAPSPKQPAAKRAQSSPAATGANDRLTRVAEGVAARPSPTSKRSAADEPSAPPTVPPAPGVRPSGGIGRATGAKRRGREGSERDPFDGEEWDIESGSRNDRHRVDPEVQNLRQLGLTLGTDPSVGLPDPRHRQPQRDR